MNNTPTPPQADALQIVRIDSLMAALAKLTVEIKIEDLLKAIHDEDEAKRAKVAADADTLQVVHIDSLTAALPKLKFKIKIEDLVKAIHDEDEAKRVKVAADATQRRSALSKRKSAPHSLPAI